MTPRAAAVDSQGRTVVGGWANDSGIAIPWLFVARFDAQGKLDASFGDGGITRFDLPNLSVDFDHQVVIDDRDRVLISARQNGDQLLVRFTPAGILDMSFGADGLARRTRPPSESSPANTRALAVRDKVYVFETVTVPGAILGTSEKIIRATRYGSSGALDVAYTTKLAAEPTGKIELERGQRDTMFVGNGRSIVKLTHDGVVDTTFGDAGRLVQPHDVFTERTDGKIVVANGSSLATLAVPGTGGPIPLATLSSGLDGVFVKLGARCDNAVVVALRLSGNLTGIIVDGQGKVDRARGTGGGPALPSTTNADLYIRPAIDPSRGTMMWFGRASTGPGTIAVASTFMLP